MKITPQYAAQVAFGKPVVYNGIKVYPILCRDYMLFQMAKDGLLVNQMQEKNMRLINLPYLDYVYMRALYSREQIHDWSALLAMTGLSLRVPGIRMTREKRAVLLHFTQDGNDFTVGAADFDELRELMCDLNDILIENLDPSWEAQLQEAQKKIADISKSDLEFEDVLCALGVLLGKLPSEMEELPIRTYTRYRDLAFARDDYRLNHAAELQGTKFKGKITHWLNHFAKQGKYDNVVKKGKPNFNT